MSTEREAALPPRAPAVFVGREAELERVIAACATVRVVAVYGVGGVGKTAFMLHAAAAIAERVGGRVVHCSCGPADDPGTIARQVLHEVAPRHARLAATGLLETLAGAAAAQPLVLCLDDLHRLSGDLVLEAVAFLATRQASLWFLLGSRVELGLSPAEVDHLVVRLGGLGAADARRLWDALRGLYGTAAQRFSADAGAVQSPFTIKQAFARGATGTARDPLGVRGLPPAEREALVQLAAFRRPVPAAAPGLEDPTVVDSLQRQFLVEVGATGEVSVHDLVREALRGAGLLPEARHHARCLEHYRRGAGAGPPPEEVEAELLHHALAAGEHDAALAIIAAHASLQRGRGPVGATLERELAAAIDALATARVLPPVIRLLRARILWRQGRAEAGYEAACAISPDDDPHADLDQGEAAYCRGALAAALPRLERALADERLLLPARLWAAIILVEAQLRLGEVARARRTVATATALCAPAGPVAHIAQHLMEGLVAFYLADFPAAAAAFDAARAVGPAFPLVDSYARTAAVAAGRPWDERVGLDPQFGSTLLFRQRARLLRTHEHLWRGEPVPALALARAARRECGAAGYQGLELWAAGLEAEAAASCRSPLRAARRLRRRLERARGAGAALEGSAELSLARAWLVAGRLEEAAAAARRVAASRRVPEALRGLAAMVAARCAPVAGGAGGALARRLPRGLVGGHAVDWQVGRVDVLLGEGQLGAALAEARGAAEAAAAGGWQLLRCQARLLEAEALLRLGQAPAARAALAAARGLARRGRYAPEALRAGLLRAALARLDGDAGDVGRRLARVEARARRRGCALEGGAAAAARAARGGLQAQADEAGRRLATRLELLAPVTCRLREPGGARSLTAGMAAALDDAAWPFFVDLVAGRARVGRRLVSLRAYPVQLATLALLARAPGAVVPAEELVRGLWGLTYHRVKHHSRVVVAISRLRQSLGAATVAAAEGGYRLVVPDAWAVVEPLPPEAAV
ncbi:MAG: winged helix-turn-helix domain-containing protein [Gemmatimonadales bacterium]|nr:winged helix-turn-helix domain-containing protein [Gemmatimonadales bacterium]